MNSKLLKTTSLRNQLLEDFFLLHPELLEAALNGYGNIKEISTRLCKYTKDKNKEKITIAAMNMALRRYLKVVDSPQTNIPFPPHLEITTRTAMYEVAIKNDSRGQKLLDKIKKEVKISKKEAFIIAEGSYEIVIFISQVHKEQLSKILKKHLKTSEIDNVGYVTVNWPKVTKNIPGIYFRITRALARSSISIQSFHTIGAEMMIIIKEAYIAKAHETLSKLFKNKLS